MHGPGDSDGRAPAFGALLLRWRAAAGLTHEELAASSGLSPEAIAALEQGRRRTPRGAIVEQLADALGLAAQERAQLTTAAARRTVGTGAPNRAAADAAWARHPWWPAGAPPRMVDRAAELETIQRLLTVDGVRLLTLTGPAGVGKTRLALAAAARLTQETQRFPDGVTLVDLTSVRDPVLVLSEIAYELCFLDDGSRLLPERLMDALAQQQRLVVLDNFEHVLPATAQLADLLAACPALVLLVTSRVQLKLRWEQTLRIPPLPIPDLSRPVPPLDELVTIPSVELFMERARARRHDFLLSEQQAPMVARLVVQLDGLPLALELAAARTATLGLPMIAHRLGDRLRLLRWEAADLPVRQQSLKAAVGWSYDLLSEEERCLFRCLGVFVRRVSLDAITAAATALARVMAGGMVGEREEDSGRTLEGLLSLAEQSLILPAPPTELAWQHVGQGEAKNADDEEEAEPAFGMLETVRAYAEELLAAAGELETVRRAHASFFLALAERAEPELRGFDQRTWFFRLESDHDNLRAALRWLLDQEDPADHAWALRLAGALGRFWSVRGYTVEGHGWLREALRRAPEAEADVRTHALIRAGVLLKNTGQLKQAKDVLDEALALSLEHGDQPGIAEAIMELGTVAIHAGDLTTGVSLAEQALTRWRKLGDRCGIANTLATLGRTATLQGAYHQGASLLTEALEQLQAIGDLHGVGLVNYGLAVSVGMLGDLRRAVALVRDSLRLSRRLRDRLLLTHAAEAALWLAGEDTELERCMRLLGAVEALTEATGHTRWVWLPQLEQRLAALRARVEAEGWETAYRAGRSLPAEAVAGLLGEVLEDVARTLDQEPQLQAGREPEQRQQPSPLAAPSPLSAREQEVLRLVAKGLSSKAIGHQLFIAPSTVNYNLTSIFHKLGVNSRAQAVAIAAQRGLL
jgi:predicted ATPase/DNA-binding CsgD family transcriptional regulator/DNA-binding XRE family transcriptional regulator